MRLYVEPMDAVVVDVDAAGRVRLENEDWSEPTLQERRAPQILNAKRRIRIAKGSGVRVAELNTMLNKFGEMQQMMKKMGKFQKMMMKGGGALPGMFRR